MLLPLYRYPYSDISECKQTAELTTTHLLTASGTTRRQNPVEKSFCETYLLTSCTTVRLPFQHGFLFRTLVFPAEVPRPCQSGGRSIAAALIGLGITTDSEATPGHIWASMALIPKNGLGPLSCHDTGFATWHHTALVRATQ